MKTLPLTVDQPSGVSILIYEYAQHLGFAIMLNLRRLLNIIAIVSLNLALKYD